MGYREFAVPAALGGLVEASWSAGVPAGTDEVVAAILPDGCMDLLWDGSDLRVAGPDTAPHPSRRSPGTLACGLRFAPGRLPAFLGVPASELRDTRLPLSELHPAVARTASARLADAAGRGDARAVLRGLAAVAGALPATTVDPAIAALAARLDSPDPGRTSVVALADSFGWTTRTLHRRCLAAFGYGPAVLRRILRFRRVTGMLATGVRPAEAAAMAGYADQPHLSREVRALGGTSPRAFVQSGSAA